MKNKKITDAQILRCIKSHTVSTCTCQERATNALAKSVRYILNGGNPYSSIRIANRGTHGFQGWEVNGLAHASDHPTLAGYEYAGYLADELRYQAGLVDTDIEDFLNEKGFSHGTIGRKYLADVLAVSMAYPFWHEPAPKELAEMLSEKYGKKISPAGIHQGLRVVMGCKGSEVWNNLVVLKREYLRADDTKPRGYIGRIHNVMLSMGLNTNTEGFNYLRFSVWTVIRSGHRDRRMFMKDILPAVSNKYNKTEGLVKSAMDEAVRHAALGGFCTEVIFRIVNVLEPQNQPLYQLADEVLRGHGYGNRQQTKGYECLRVAMTKLAEDDDLFGLGITNLLRVVDKEIGYQAFHYHYSPDCPRSYCLAKQFSKPLKEYQAAGSLLAFIHQMAKELISEAEAQNVAA